MHSTTNTGPISPGPITKDWHVTEVSEVTGENENNTHFEVGPFNPSSDLIICLAKCVTREIADFICASVNAGLAFEKIKKPEHAAASF